MILNLTIRTSHLCRSASKLSQVSDIFIAVSFTRNHIFIQLKITTFRRHRLIRLAGGGGIFSTIPFFALVLTARNDAAGDEERCAGPPHRRQGL